NDGRPDCRGRRITPDQDAAWQVTASTQIRLTIDGSPVAVVRESSTSVAAFSLVCPHQGNTLQKVSSGFYCPGHGATFNLQGTWTGGDGKSSLHSYPATLETGSGTVTVG